jgi:hypothetical protein
MKKWITEGKWMFLSAALGAGIGYAYWYFYGCTNGCSITGNALNSTLYFMVLGAMIPGLLKSDKRNEVSDSNAK